MSWEIFLGIVALVGFLITVSTPMLKLNTSITKLNETINSIKDIVNKNDETNKQSHQRIYDRLDGHDRMINGHNERLSNMESMSARRVEEIKELEKNTMSQENRIVHMEATLDNVKKDVTRNEQKINQYHP